MNEGESAESRPIANPLAGRAKHADSKALWIALGLIAVVVAAAVAGLVLLGDSGSSGSWTTDDGPSLSEEAEALVRMDDAYEFCVEQVKERLRAPATAQFSERDDARDGDRYLFTGVVDSENGFGALLRSDFACEIRHTGSGFVADTVAVAEG